MRSRSKNQETRKRSYWVVESLGLKMIEKLSYQCVFVQLRDPFFGKVFRCTGYLIQILPDMSFDNYLEPFLL